MKINKKRPGFGPFLQKQLIMQNRGLLLLHPLNGRAVESSHREILYTLSTVTKRRK